MSSPQPESQRSFTAALAGRCVFVCGLVGLLAVLLIVSAAPAATYTWVGATDDVLVPANWSASLVPTSTDDAVFGAVGNTNPNVSGAWSVLNLRFSSSPAYTFGGTGVITLPVGGSIDTGAATGNIIFNNGGLSFTRAAGINATGSANVTVSATTPFVMGIGGTNADPYLNAVGGDITINSLVDFTLATARRNLICAPNAGRTITLAGGVSPTTTTNRLGNVYVRGQAGGKVILGNSTTWAGWTDIYEADLEINHNDSLGAPGQMGGAYFGGTQWLGTAGSLLLTNNITSPEGMYLTGRSTATSGIKNKSGHNTLSGVLGGGGGAVGDTMYNFESVGTASGDLFEISGIIQPTTWNTGAYTVALRGAGPGLISGTISSTVLAVNTGTFDGGTLGVTKFDGGTWTLTNANTYTGPTTIAAGTLALANNFALGTTGSIANSSAIDVKAGAQFDVSAVSGYAVVSTQTLKGAGTVTGTVTLGSGAILAPGDVGTAGTLAVNGAALVNAGSTLNYDLSNVTTVGSGVNDLLSIGGGLTIDTGAAITVNKLAGAYAAGTYRLISYTGSYSHSYADITTGVTLNVVGPSSRQIYALKDNIAGQINLQVSGTSLNLTWVGNSSPNTWDTNPANTDWNKGSGASDFQNGDNVTFSDTGSNVIPVNMSGSLAPGAMTFTNNTGHDYTLGGTGAIVSASTPLAVNGTGKVTFSNSAANTFDSIALNAGTLAFSQPIDVTLSASLSGPGNLRKEGTNILTLAGSSAGYTGVITVAAGTLQAGGADALGSSSGGTVVNGGTLDANSFDLTGEPISVQGVGVGGNGALVNSNVVGTGTVSNVTLAGNTTVGGAGILAIRSIQGVNKTLTKVGGSETGFLAGTGETGLGDIHVNAGTMYFYGNATMGNTANTATIANGAILGVSNSTVAHAKPITVDATGGQIDSYYGRNTISADITMNGATLVTTEGPTTTRSWLVGYYSTLTLSGKLTGPGSLTKSNMTTTPANGGGLIYLTNDHNDYSGTTTINAGIVSIGHAGTTGSLGGTGDVVNNGILQFELNRAYKTSDLLGNRDITGSGTLAYGGPNIVGFHTDINQFLLPNAVTTIDRDYSYTGGTDISQGKVILKSANGLGGTPGNYGSTNISSHNDCDYSGELDFDNQTGLPWTIQDNFNLTGSGGFGGFNYNGPGVIRNVSGTNKITGSIVIENPGVHALIVSAGGSLELAGPIANSLPGDRSVVLGGTAPGIVSGSINDYLNTGGQIISRTGIEKVGTGTWTFDGSVGGGAYSNGVATVYDGTLKLVNNAAFSAPAAIALASSTATFDASANGASFTLGYYGTAQMLVGPGTVKGDVALPGTSLGMISTGGPAVLTLTDVNSFPSTTTQYYNSPNGEMKLLNNLALGSGGDTLQFTLNSNTLNSGGKISVNGVVTPSTVSAINVAIVPNTFLENGGTVGTPKVYTLLTGGAGTNLNSGAGFVLAGADPNQNTRYTLSLDYATDVTKLKLKVVGSNANLIWQGTTATDWDLGSATAGSMSWTGAADQKFYQADDVTFDDTGTTAVNVAARVMPASITVNNSTGHDYVLSGAGAITGGTGITKTGFGNLRIATTGGNDFTGKVTITGGTLTVGNAASLGGKRYPLNEGTEINGGTLNLNGQDVRYERISIQGSGYDPGTGPIGAIVNSGSAVPLMHVELTGDAAIGGTANWRVESWARDGENSATFFDPPYIKGNNHTLTKVGSNEIDFNDMGETNLGDIRITSGALYFLGNTTMGNVAKTVYISNGATLGIQSSSLVGAPVHAKPIVVEASGGEINTYNAVSTINAGVTLNGTAIVSTSVGSTMTLNGVITGIGGLTKANKFTGGGTVILGGNNNYQGPTLISAGKLALAATGQISTASLITNNDTFQIDGGTHALGTIGGMGSMYVLGNSAITAASITQGMLQIGGTAPAAAAASAAVPEPSVWLLLIAGSGGFALFLRKKAA